MNEIKQGVIFCGGLGSRLGNLTRETPKPMIKICDKPFLEHLIIQLKKNGIKNILLLVGYRSEKIKNYFKKGKNFGVRINYSYMPPETKTGKRLYNVRNKLKEKFLLLYCDNYSSLNIHKLNDALDSSKKKIVLTIVRKKIGNCKIDKNLTVNYTKERNKKFPYVEIGYMAVKRDVLKYLKNKNEDFSSFLQSLSKKKLILCNLQKNKYLSIGDKKRLARTKKCFSNNQYILIDRDGVLNKKSKSHRYVRDLNDLNLNLNLINKLPIHSKLICITNQAGIATKDLKLNNLIKINTKIKNFLRERKIKLVKYFISKHHFKSKSFYRKPNPGNFFKASNEFNFILDKTFYIGDDKRDLEAAYNSNSFAIYTGNEYLTKKEKMKYKFIILKNSIKKIFNEKKNFKF